MEHRQTLKNSMYDGSVRVPQIWAGPGISPGRIVRWPVSLLDIYPTLLELAGLPQRDFLVGRSLMPLMRANGDATHDRPDFVISQYHSDYSNTGTFMVATESHKLLIYGTHRTHNADAYARPQLFDLSNDTWELHDIAPARPDLVASLLGKLNSTLDWVQADREAKELDLAFFRNFTAHDWDEDGSKCVGDMRIAGFPDFSYVDAERLACWANRACGGIRCGDKLKLV